MKSYDEIATSKLADASGYVSINKETMQHQNYPNVFGIGDCTTMPSKTAAAVAAESSIVYQNLCDIMEGRSPTVKVNNSLYLKIKF